MRPLVEQLVEPVAVPVDAERVGEGEGDLAPGFARDFDRSHHRVTRRLRVPQIAFKIEDRRVADLLLVERALRQVLRGAEEGVHRPVPVGRDQDHRTRSRLAHVGSRSDELDPRGGEIMTIEFAELVGRDLADEPGAAAECRNARRRIAGRSAANLVRRAHVRIEPLGLLRRRSAASSL